MRDHDLNKWRGKKNIKKTQNNSNILNNGLSDRDRRAI